MTTLDPQDLLFSADDGPQIEGQYTDEFPMGGKSRKHVSWPLVIWVLLTVATFSLGAAYVAMGYAPSLYLFEHHGF